jgi:hypothetical protein
MARDPVGWVAVVLVGPVTVEPASASAGAMVNLFWDLRGFRVYLFFESPFTASDQNNPKLQTADPYGPRRNWTYEGITPRPSGCPKTRMRAPIVTKWPRRGAKWPCAAPGCVRPLHQVAARGHFNLKLAAICTEAHESSPSHGTRARQPQPPPRAAGPCRPWAGRS